VWLAVGNAVFVGGGGVLYLLARRNLLRRSPPGRRTELFACLLVTLLAFAGFALAQLGINESWTGNAVLADSRWAGYAGVFSGALLAAHGLLRLQRSRGDQLLLPVAAFLAVLGLINVYVRETRMPTSRPSRCRSCESARASAPFPTSSSSSVAEPTRRC